MKPIEKLTGDEAFRPLCPFTVSLSRWRGSARLC